MPKTQPTILKVVIASPSDVKKERDLVEKVVTELNRTTARDRSLRLETYRWETDAYPGFHAEGPQGIIDDILGIKEAWVLIGIFWSKFGTPGTDGKTGTEHEIDMAIEAWEKNKQPQPMIYFRTEPPPLKSSAERKQWVHVADYQEKIAAKKGLYWEYETPPDFAEALRNNLQNYVRNKYPIAGDTETPPPPASDFLRTYRTRHAHQFETYDMTNLGVRLAGAEEPRTVYLDDIYLTLRFAKGYSIQELEEGKPIESRSLPNRKRHLLVRGPAGAGKTTWMKRTFRALLREDALPIFVELRGLAKDWKDHGERPLDDALVRCVAKEHSAEGLLEAVKAKAGPRPILLIDGWDELGELGRKLRTKLLGFLDEHPCVLAVVSSRPYGKDVPSENAGFEELDLQPLNNDEVGAFAKRFHELCYGEETAKAAEKAGEFLAALQNSHGAEDLARTPLLLTMMLGLSRTRPLPDKRHKLYEECVKALLAERPKRYAQEGVQYDDWYPEDEEERLLVVAALAYGLQESTGEAWAGPIVADRERMESYLPKEWDPGRKKGFLSWLSGPASLLNERTDHTLAFTHLSFQEFLAAWNRSRLPALKGNGHITFAVGKAKTEQWWETLRLWAALVEGQQGRETLQPVLETLLDTNEGSALAGAMLADGLAAEGLFERWAQDFALRVRTAYFRKAEDAARAWAASRQQRRREALPGLWADAATSAGWLPWLRLDSWRREAHIPGSLQTPVRGTHAGRLLACLSGDPEVEDDLAVSRILCGADPAWPAEASVPALLQVWPSHRRLAAMRLQSFVASDPNSDLPGLLNRDLLSPPRSESAGRAARSVRALSRRLAWDWDMNVGHTPPYWARKWALYWAREWALYWARELGSYRAKQLVEDLARKLAGYLAFYWAWDGPRTWAEFMSSYWVQDEVPSGAARMYAQDYFFESRLNPAGPAHLDFLTWELGSFGRASARARLAARNPASPKYSSPVEVELLTAACRLSLRPNSPPDEFNNALKEYEMGGQPEPLWPALARHLTRRATPEDKALLEDLAQHPEKRDPPLSWGLRYIVRGDILMEDGTVVTIDELCDQLNLPRLPYIEDLPPELEVDWEDEGPPQKPEAKKKTAVPKPPPKKKPPQKKTPMKKKAAKKKG